MPVWTSSRISRAPAGAGGFAGRPEVAGGQRADAGLALDRFEEDGGGGVINRGAEGVDVTEGDVHDAAGQRRERRPVGLLGGQRQGAHGAAVEGAFEGDDLGRGCASGPCSSAGPA